MEAPAGLRPGSGNWNSAPVSRCGGSALFVAASLTVVAPLTGENMPEYLLRMEGVNLDSFVYDTQDLSTIRGGSLLLLGAARSVAAWPRVKSISRGASAALVSFTVTNDADALAFRDEIRRRLQTGRLA